MSVRKLALAVITRVNGLREKLIAEPQASLRTCVVAGAMIIGSSAFYVDDVEAQNHVSPIQDPFAFDPDFRWFEPIYEADFEDMKPKKRANRGWYGSYDRLALRVSRPEGGADENKMDSGWGHRYDLGFMTDKDSGWSMTYMSVDGPNAYDTFDRLRLNERNLTERITIPFVTAGGVQPFGIFPEDNRNNPGMNSRFYPVGNSENVADLKSFEFNKTWRLEPYHYGGMLEPLVGFRYMKFTDTFRQTSYTSGLVADPGSTLGILNPPFFGEQYTTQRSVAENDMYGGQVGFRYFKFQNRFRYSGEFKFFTMGNSQFNNEFTRTDTTVYAGGIPTTPIAPGAIPLALYQEQTPRSYGSNSQFVYGFDVRGEVSYQLTKMFELRTGVQVLDIAQGVWRGRLSDQNDRTNQSVVMVGATFGIAINR